MRRSHPARDPILLTPFPLGGATFLVLPRECEQGIVACHFQAEGSTTGFTLQDVCPTLLTEQGGVRDL